MPAELEGEDDQRDAKDERIVAHPPSEDQGLDQRAHKQEMGIQYRSAAAQWRCCVRPSLCWSV